MGSDATRRARPDPMARTALDVAMRIKEQAVAAQGAGGQVYTMLHLHRDGLLWAVFPLVEDDPLTRHQLAAAVVVGSPANEATLIMDTYLADPPKLGEWRTVEQRFAGGDPTVVECLAGIAVRSDGTSGQWTVRYTVPGRRVTWEEPEDNGRARGPLADALGWAFEHQGEAPKTFDTPEGLAAELGLPLIAYPGLRPPARNGPCGCESGRKAKHCCWRP